MFIHDEDEPVARRRFTRRALLVGASQVGVLGALMGRLYQLQVLEGSRYGMLADDNRIHLQATAPRRGLILDRFGEVLADNVEGFRAVMVPSSAGGRREEILHLFSRVVPLRPETIAMLLRRMRRQGPGVPTVIAEDLSFEQVAEINLLAPHLPGIQTEVVHERRYHHQAAVGHIVGHVGAIERRALDDDPVMRLPGMRIGRAGVEAGLEEALRGVGGRVKLEVDARGHIQRHLERIEPRPGRDIRLTIDRQLQAKAMARLESEQRASVVALDVATGEVLVMASTPAYAPPVNAPAQGGGALAKLKGSVQRSQLNRAIGGQYPPGSTFKMVTALAALGAGVIDHKERIDCNGRFELADQTYRCWSRGGHGRCDLHRALKESCDVYFYECARRVGMEAIAAAARELGLGETYAAGIALQKPGLVPTPDWKMGRFNRAWLAGETILAGIGQGYVLTTPLQLAVMTARLATGMKVVPTLVRRDEGAPVETAGGLEISDTDLAAIRRAMQAVVNESGGTGSNARVSDERVVVAGKTGTSQVSRVSSQRTASELKWEERDHALFVAFAPAETPRYALAAVVEHGGGGGAAAAPVVRDVLEMLLERERKPQAGTTERSERERRG